MNCPLTIVDNLMVNRFLHKYYGYDFTFNG